MKKIAIIDADLIERKRHRFPNLVCMKLSGYYKDLGYEVELKMTWGEYENYEKVFVSKVFTDTPYDHQIEQAENVEYGGTGFFFDKAPNLPDVIEHYMPDYDLYKPWIEDQIAKGISRNEFKEYLDYSIGFLTRGCFRKCPFCVNQKYDRAFCSSSLHEFYDPSKKKICLLDDNFLSHPQWRDMLESLIKTGKPFKFKQGLDERLLTDEKCELLFNAKYDGNITFAFDNVADYELINKKLDMIRRHTNKQCVFYVLVGFDYNDRYDEDFWYQDIVDAFKRIELLLRYGCIPYIMRFNRYEESPNRGMYINLARWCNQPNFLKKTSFNEFCALDFHKGRSTERYFNEFKKRYPEFNKEYFDAKFINY